jgi:16S rRNA (uracil1498-N3)-methyltransferase
VTRKLMALRLEVRLRDQTAPGDLHYLFAPLKHARLDYIVQKAVEMGASAIRPVVTRRTQNARINTDRMRANAIEAAEQCGIITLPTIAEPTPLAAALSTWDADRSLIFCDEDAPLGDALANLRTVARRPLAVLIGPEGGFDEAERAVLLAVPSVIRLSLGPRILRADTAGVAALALVQASIGDWDRDA